MMNASSSGRKRRLIFVASVISSLILLVLLLLGFLPDPFLEKGGKEGGVTISREGTLRSRDTFLAEDQKTMKQMISDIRRKEELQTPRVKNIKNNSSEFLLFVNRRKQFRPRPTEVPEFLSEGAPELSSEVTSGKSNQSSNTSMTGPTRQPQRRGFVNKNWYSKLDWRGAPADLTQEQKNKVQSFLKDLEFAYKKMKSQEWTEVMFSGAVFVADGKGNCDDVDVPILQGEDRIPSPLFRMIRKGCAELTNFTILHVGLEDNCVYSPSKFFGKDDHPAHQLLKKMIAEHSNLFFLHWNPTLVDEARGLIGKRIVPIPHFQAVQRRQEVKTFSRYQDREKLVIWRGTTTGKQASGNFTESPRWKVVNAFRQAEKKWEETGEGGLLPRRTTREATTHADDHAKSRDGSGNIKREGNNEKNDQPGQASSMITWAPPKAPPKRFWANIKFNTRSQFVTNETVPDSFMGPPLQKYDQLHAAVNLDMDGNGNSWEGLRWKLAAGNAVIKAKSKRFVQWYYHKLVHGVHLLNVDLENQDIVEVTKELLLDDDLGERLSTNALIFAEDYLTNFAAAEYLKQTLRDVWLFHEDCPGGSPYLGKDWRIIQEFDPNTHYVQGPTPAPPPAPAALASQIGHGIADSAFIEHARWLAKQNGRESIGLRELMSNKHGPL